MIHADLIALVISLIALVLSIHAATKPEPRNEALWNAAQTNANLLRDFMEQQQGMNKLLKDQINNVAALVETVRQMAQLTEERWAHDRAASGQYP